MDFNSKITNHAGWINELEALCDRLKVASIQIQGTRLDLYRKTFATINKFITENREEELVKKLPLPTFINDLHESQELVEACDEFADLTQAGLRVRIEKALKGPRELQRETPEKGEPRNYLFELVMSGLLKRAGFNIYLDRNEDIFFEFGGRPFFVECKLPRPDCRNVSTMLPAKLAGDAMMLERRKPEVLLQSMFRNF